MGCGGSKKDVVENTDIFDPQSIKPISENAKPDALRKEITEIYRKYIEMRKIIQPLLAEKLGIQACLDESREKVMVLLARKDELLKERDPLLSQTWEKDAEEVYKSFQMFSQDKDTLVRILINRNRWQLNEIAAAFERKYGRPLLQFVVSEMTTAMGKLATGGNTGLSRLLTYRIMEQPERDAAFMRDFSDGMSLVTDGLIEIICTRSNIELKLAVDRYFKEYKKYLTDIIKSKASYKNFRDFMMNVLECNRDEEFQPLDDATAAQYAKELYDAGAGRTVGIDPEPFIRILSGINHIQFESINEHYHQKQLLKDISSKLGGDFEVAVLARVADKYEYLSTKLEKALKGFSVDKEAICRIIGSLSRQECVRLREAYDRLFPAKTLEEHLKASLKKGHFLQACMLLIRPDLSLTPLQSDKEIGEDEFECGHEGERAKAFAIASYQPEKMVERGELELLAAKKKKKTEKMTTMEVDSEQIDVSVAGEGGGNEVNHGDNGSKDDELNPSMDDESEYGVPSFTWDPLKGRFMDPIRLNKEYKDCQDACREMVVLKERLTDEIVALKDIYFSIVKHQVETEGWIRILSNHCKNIRDFIAAREKLSGGSGGVFSTKKK